MNERHGHDPYGQQPRLLGYDEYGQPVYEQPGYEQPQTEPDPFPYADHSRQVDAYGSYRTETRDGGYGHDPYGQEPGVPQTYEQQAWIPQQSGAGEYGYYGDGTPERPGHEAGAQHGTPERLGVQAEDEGAYRTEQFSFVEEPTDDSEDVIDWLKFTESRTERREEAKRRGRNRWTALFVVLVLVAVGGVGWLWYAGKLPGMGPESGGGAASAAGQQRDVIVVHLRSTEDGSSSTALLVDNAEAGRGTMVLLPNSLAVSTESGGTTTLAKSVQDEGAAPTRESLDRLLGADIKGTWRLDTPYLETLVEMAGGISVDTDTSVPAAKRGGKPQVEQGRAQNLDGRAAVAYATYRAPGETQRVQLARFGAVMEQTLQELSTDPDAVTKRVEALGQVADPSLSEAQLGASLAGLAQRADKGAYATRTLPVRANGTLSRSTAEGLVKKVLGGTVSNSDPDGVLRVKVTDASGSRGSAQAASAALVNSGCTVIDGARGGARARSVVTYADPGQQAKAAEVATTLGLPDSAVRHGRAAANAEVSVVLGRDYKG